MLKRLLERGGGCQGKDTAERVVSVLSLTSACIQSLLVDGEAHLYLQVFLLWPWASCWPEASECEEASQPPTSEHPLASHHSHFTCCLLGTGASQQMHVLLP